MKKALHPSVIARYLNHPNLKNKDLEYILGNCFYVRKPRFPTFTFLF